MGAWPTTFQAKDAYDVLLGVSRYLDGPDAAIAAFQAEASAGNREGRYSVNSRRDSGGQRTGRVTAISNSHEDRLNPL